MASQYKNLRCPGCDGTLEYNKEKRVWVCIYCGNEIRREEEYDGLYTIKNVVKQVLVDLAYLRLDSALKNLVECQKISSDYVGTIIAEISYKVYTLITPGACQQGEIKGIYGQLKRLYQRLQDIDAEISTEEEGLYEAFDGNNDAFGVLLLVFDTLAASSHVSFVTQFLDASAVYSRDLNSKLLNYGFKNNDLELINKVFSNADNINCREALFLMFSSYADGEEKRAFSNKLFAGAYFRSDDHKYIKEYLVNTNDSVETKVIVYCNAVEYGVGPSIDVVMDHILTNEVTADQVERVVMAFTQTHPKDAELYAYLDQIFAKHAGMQAKAEINILMDSGLFIKPSEKSVRIMVNRSDWNINDRTELLDKVDEFKLDAKAKDAVFAEILLRNAESTDNRLAMVQVMMKHIETVSTNTFSEYILCNNKDGERKPEVLDTLFQLNLNMSFFRELLNKYLQSYVDAPDVKKCITEMLGAKGLHVDSTILVDMACSSTNDNYMQAVAFIQNAINNGTRIGNNDASIYLERVIPDNYKSELIALLHTPNSQISDTALACYVLKANDALHPKAQNSLVFAEQNGKSFGTTTTEVVCFNLRVQCNLFQAYVLTTQDSMDTVSMITTAMKNAGAKLNPNVSVNGQSIKFKKLVTDNKSQLSSVTANLCEENKVFSLFF